MMPHKLLNLSLLVGLLAGLIMCGNNSSTSLSAHSTNVMSEPGINSLTSSSTNSTDVISQPEVNSSTPASIGSTDVMSHAGLNSLTSSSTGSTDVMSHAGLNSLTSSSTGSTDVMSHAGLNSLTSPSTGSTDVMSHAGLNSLTSSSTGSTDVMSHAGLNSLTSSSTGSTDVMSHAGLNSFTSSSTGSTDVMSHAGLNSLTSSSTGSTDVMSHAGLNSLTSSSTGSTDVMSHAGLNSLTSPSTGSTDVMSHAGLNSLISPSPGSTDVISQPGLNSLTSPSTGSIDVMSHPGLNSLTSPSPGSTDVISHTGLNSLTSSATGSTDEQFMSQLLLDHRRYCGRKGICSGYRFDRCYRCEPCQCDDLCPLYGDCCPDVSTHYSTNITSNHILSQDCVSEMSRMYGDTIHNVTARTIVVRRYFMVTSCHGASSELCEESPTLPPVTVIADNVTFLNKKCAACNNVTQYIPWSVQIDCEEQMNVSSYRSKLEILTSALNDETCRVYYHPPVDVTARQCYLDDSVISTCNVTGLWSQYDVFTERACAAFITVKIVDGLRYRNPFCFVCNTNNTRKLFSKCKRKIENGPVAFSALLDFSDIFLPSSKDPTAQCDEGHIYDEEKDRCRAITCSAGKQLVDMQCVVNFAVSKGLGYEIYFNMESRDVLPLADEEDLLHTLPAILEGFILNSWFNNKVMFHDFALLYNTTGENGTCLLETQTLGLYVTLITVDHVNQEQFEKQLLSLKNINFTFATEDRVLSFTTYPSSEARYVGQTRAGRYQDQSSCVISISMNHGQVDPSITDVKSKEMYFIQVSNLLKCPQIELDSDEYKLHDTNNTLSIPWLNRSLLADDYETTDNGKIKICLKHFKPEGYIFKRIHERPDSDAIVIVSMTCTSLSLFCLFLTFMTFCIFKPLRQIPGQNNMNLCVTLFAGQLLYLVGSGQTSIKGVCEAMGIFIHYFWLAAFSSMAVCSFHMFRVFTSMRNRDDSSDRKRKFLQYCIFVYGTPVIIVVATLVIHLIISKGATIGYGGSICYLSTAASVGLAFGIPVAVTVVVNTVFFFITVRSIRISPKLAKNQHDEQHILVYVKLSSLTGITWITGFVAIGTQIRALEYMFIVINACQGVFLFFSFVCNRRIFKMFTDCCKGTDGRRKRGRYTNYANSNSKSQTKSTTFTISNADTTST